MAEPHGTKRVMSAGFARAVKWVAVFNLAYFGVEFASALSIGSVSLFADSVDFLEDACVNFLILAALAWSAKHRARVGMILAGLILIPGLATLWTAVQKFAAPSTPNPVPLTLTGAGALIVNVGCALLLTKYRRHSGSLAKAAFLSARNDALANAAIIGAGLITAWRSSVWPDLVVGVAIALINAGAAKEVYEAAREEHRNAAP